MILILSSASDFPTDLVISWISSVKEKFVRVNESDKVELIKISINNKRGCDVEMQITNIYEEKCNVRLSDIKSFWYRRGFFNIDFSANTELHHEVLKYIERSKTTVVDFINNLLSEKFHVNKHEDVKLNKLVVLNVAQKLGLNIPDSIIGKYPQISKLSGFITKEYNQVPLVINNRFLPSLTKDVNLNSFKFNHSLCQRKIGKRFEIRSFYIHGDFYSMAIFSQRNDNTKTDFRNDDYEKPNRNVRFVLPQYLKEKLKALMRNLDLNSGSIDLIYSDKEFVFLEVNPVGQWHFLSKPCNYNLEKIIAKSLIENENT